MHFEIINALGGTLLAEELKGDFSAARGIAERQLQTVTGPPRAAALLDLAVVDLLAGNVIAAEAGLDAAEKLAGGDPASRLRVAAWRLLACAEKFSTWPDGAAANAVELSARWQPVEGIRELDARYQELRLQVTDAAVLSEAWLAGEFLFQLRPIRLLLQSVRFGPPTPNSEQILNHALTALCDPLRVRVADGLVPAGPGAAYWLAADLGLRGQWNEVGGQFLGKALEGCEATGDRAGWALGTCLDTDYHVAPLSFPLAWNLALQDSSTAGSDLTMPLEMQEFRVPAAPILKAGERAYQQAAEAFIATGALRGQAATLLRQGYLLICHDEFAAAAELLQAALSRSAETGDGRGEALARAHLAMTALARDQTDAALEQARAIGQWGRQSGSLSYALGLGVLLNRWARHWLIRRGHFERALGGYRAAREIFAALDATINLAQNFMDQGTVLQAVGDRSGAFNLFEQAFEGYRAAREVNPAVADNLVTRLVLTGNQAWSLALTGRDTAGMERTGNRMAQLLETLGGAKPAAPPPLPVTHRTPPPLPSTPPAPASPPPLPPATATELVTAMEHAMGGTAGPLGMLARMAVDYARVLTPLYRARRAKECGDTATAERELTQARTALKDVSDDQRVFLQTPVLGEQERWAEAAEEFRAYISRREAMTSPMDTLAKLLAQFGGPQGAAELKLNERRIREQAFSGFVRTRAYPEARQYWDALLAVGGPEWWRTDSQPWIILSDAGEMFEALGDPAGALVHFENGIGELEAQRNSLSRDEMKTAFASDKGGQWLYFCAARCALAAGQAERSFHLAEQGKARALLDLMTGDARGRSMNDRELPALGRWRELNARLALRRGLLAQARGQQSPEPARIAEFTKLVEADDAELHEIEAAINRQRPGLLAGLGVGAAVPAASEIARHLQPGDVLLEWMFLGEDLLGWALTSQGVVMQFARKQKAWELALELSRFRDACAKPTGDWHAAGAKLAEILLAPFKAQLAPAKRVLVVPYASGHAVPFAALPFAGQTLGAQRVVIQLPSASILPLLGDGRVPPDGPILAVGNPTDNLRHAEQEAKSAARRFGAKPLLGPDATEAAVRLHLPGCRLVLFATHGQLSPENPLASSLALADGKELSLYELMGIHLDADLVVLSACETARGEATAGDDLVGLARGVLAAGARAAVVSLWRVDDAATGLLMAHLMGHLRDGMPAGSALAAAQQWLSTLQGDACQNALRELFAGSDAAPSAERFGMAAGTRTADAQKFNHPYYYAPFICVSA